MQEGLHRAGRRRRTRWSATLAAAVAAGLAMLAYAVYLPVPAPDAPRVLVSVDRTLWNRLGINRLTWVRTLRNAGLRPVLVDFSRHPPGAGTAAAWLEEVDGLILSGGGDVAPARYGDPAIRARDVSAERDAFELALLAAAENRGMPILGVCRGLQLINVYRGGTLGDFRADDARFDRHHRLPPGHAVRFEADSRLAGIFGTQMLDSVITWHGQYVAEPGAGVEITGRAPDGTPEAIEVGADSGFGMLGVQWHAEIAPWDSHQQRLFDAFAAAAERHSRTKAENSRR